MMIGTATIVRVAVLAWIMLAAPAGKTGADPFVGLWITRWDYRTAADVERAIREAAELGVTDIFWQARGQCDAFYRSELEPWGEELLAPGATDPGFDPLALAVERSHGAGLKIHAWVNVYPLWKGAKPPRDPKHPYLAHPEWRLYDAKGAPQALNEHYVIVNPLLPEVQDHIAGVCRDIVTRYAVDGLHLDYVRFVSDTMKDPSAFPADQRSIALFTSATGRTGLTTPEDQGPFRDFKRDEITRLVRELKKEAVGGVWSRSGVVLTAAVWRRPDLARDGVLQDSAAWLRDGTLDRALPMIYTEKDDQFGGDLAAWMSESGGRPLTPGLGLHKHTAKGGETARQAAASDAAGTAGIALFAYSTMFECADPNQPKDVRSVAARVALRKEVAGIIKARRTGIEEGGSK